MISGMQATAKKQPFTAILRTRVALEPQRRDETAQEIAAKRPMHPGIAVHSRRVFADSQP